MKLPLDSTRREDGSIDVLFPDLSTPEELDAVDRLLAEHERQHPVTPARAVVGWLP